MDRWFLWAAAIGAAAAGTATLEFPRLASLVASLF